MRVSFAIFVTTIMILSIPFSNISLGNASNIEHVTKSFSIDLSKVKYIISPTGSFVHIPGFYTSTIYNTPTKTFKFTIKRAKVLDVNVENINMIPYSNKVLSSSNFIFSLNGNTIRTSINKQYSEINYRVDNIGPKTIVTVFLHPILHKQNKTMMVTKGIISISYIPLHSTLRNTKDTKIIHAQNIIITNTLLKRQAQRLADFHNSTGTFSWVVTTSWISKNFKPATSPPFNGFSNTTTDPYKYLNGKSLPLKKDMLIGYNWTLAKKIIAFLQNESTDNNVTYITIFGNARMVPPSYYWTDQYFYLNVYEGKSLIFPNNYYDAWIPTDILYASPNYNSSHFNYYPRFAVGRLPVNPFTAKMVVNKIIYYGTHRGSIKNITLSGGQPFETPYYIGEMTVLRPINNGWIHSTNIQEYFSTLNNYNYANFTKMMKNSDMIIGISHGSGYGFVHEKDFISAWDFPITGNYSALPVYINPSCYNGAWDEGIFPSQFAAGMNGGVSIAEQMLYSPRGIIAYFGSSRETHAKFSTYFENGSLNISTFYGCSIITDGTLFGYHKLINKYGYATLGKMYEYALEYYASRAPVSTPPWKLSSKNDNPWARSYFEYTLLGDPTIKLHPEKSPTYTKPKIKLQNSVYNKENIPIIKRGKNTSIFISTNSPKIKIELVYIEDYLSKEGHIYSYYHFILSKKVLSSNEGEYIFKFTPEREGLYMLSVYTIDGKNTRLYMDCEMPSIPTIQSSFKTFSKYYENTNLAGNSPVKVITLLDYSSIEFGNYTNLTALIYNEKPYALKNITVEFYFENYNTAYYNSNPNSPLIYIKNITVSSISSHSFKYVTIKWKPVNLHAINQNWDPNDYSSAWQCIVGKALYNGQSSSYIGVFRVHLPIDIWVQRVYIKSDPTYNQHNKITFEITNIGNTYTSSTSIKISDQTGTIETISAKLKPEKTYFFTISWTPKKYGMDYIEVEALTPGDEYSINDVSYFYINHYHSIRNFVVLNFDIKPVNATQNGNFIAIQIYNYGPNPAHEINIFTSELYNIHNVHIGPPSKIKNGYDRTWMIKVNNTKTIALHFKYINLQKGMDYIYLYNENHTLIRKYTGNTQNIWTSMISGNTVYVELKVRSDMNNTGFLIDKYALNKIKVNEKLFNENIKSGTFGIIQLSINNAIAGNVYLKIDASSKEESATSSTGGSSNNLIYVPIEIKDTMPPILKSSLENRSVNTTKPIIRIHWYDPIYSGFLENKIYLDHHPLNTTLIQETPNSGFILAKIIKNLSKGMHFVKAIVKDKGNNTATLQFKFYMNLTPPILHIINPPTNPVITNSSYIWINGTTTPGANVTINGKVVNVSTPGMFYEKIKLALGKNIIFIKATLHGSIENTTNITVIYYPNISKVKNSFQYLHRKIQNISNELNSLESKLYYIKNVLQKISNTSGDLNKNLKDYFEKLMNRTNYLISNITALQYKLHKIEEYIDQNETIFNSSLSSGNISKINSIEKNITHIKSMINGINISSLNSNISTLNKDISNFQKTINSGKTAENKFKSFLPIITLAIIFILGILIIAIKRRKTQ